jgi:eukaryotic-like serine/threonine-protein kinase
VTVSARPEGSLSALVEELARAPARDLRDAWERGHRPGEVVADRFELQRELGRGGFGVVFEAWDRELSRRVAFKALRPVAGGRDAAREALLRREAEAVAQLADAAIVTLHDFGRCASGPYLILELLSGEPLARRLERGPLPPREALRVARAVAAALRHAHARGVLHRDLKPGNVFLCEGGGVKVLDFGLAHVFGGGGPRGSGTPGYMAPEQARGEDEDARTDVWAAGLLLAETLGVPPGAAPEALRSALGGAPAPLRDVALRALEADPARRFPDASALLEALERAARVVDPPPRPGRRRRLALLVAAAALALALGFWLGRGGPGPRVKVAVADVENAGGDPALDGVDGMLAAALRPSLRLELVPRARLADLAAAGAPGGRVTGDAARGAARAAGAAVLLVPAVRVEGEGYAVELSAVDPRDGRLLFSEREVAAGGEVPAAVDRLAARARRSLSEADADVAHAAAPVGAVFTTDLEASRAYFLGEQCAARPAYGQDCGAHFRRAVARDPGFAAAHYLLAAWDGWGGDRAAARAALRAAEANAARAPEKEELFIRAWSAHLAGDDATAVRLYEEAAARWPEDRHAPYQVGDLLRHDGRFAEAAPWFEKAAALDPEFGWAPRLLAECLGLSGQRDALRAWVARWEASPGPASLHALSVAHGWLGDTGAAEDAARRAAALGGGVAAQEDLVVALLFARRYAEAERDLRALGAPGSGVRPIGRYGLAAAAAYQGRPRAARAQLDAFAAERPGAGDDAVYLALRADLLAGDGDAAALRETLVALRRVDAGEAAQHAAAVAWAGDRGFAAELARDLPPGSAGERTWRAVDAWRAGDVEAGLAGLRAVSAEAPADLWRVAPLFLLGDVAAREGRDTEAIAALDAFERLYLSRTMARAWAYPIAELRLAQAEARTGRTAQARARVDRLLADVGRGEADAPVVVEARALRRKLGR